MQAAVYGEQLSALGWPSKAVMMIGKRTIRQATAKGASSGGLPGVVHVPDEVGHPAVGVQPQAPALACHVDDQCVSGSCHCCSGQLGWPVVAAYLSRLAVLPAKLLPGSEQACMVAPACLLELTPTHKCVLWPQMIGVLMISCAVSCSWQLAAWRMAESAVC